MALFPMFVDISKRICLVTGGGKVALRKVETLLKFGGEVRVISREICPEIRDLLPESSCLVIGREVKARDLEDYIRGAALVVAASGDRQFNQEISRICREYKIPVNVVDAPQECSFQFPAVVKKGEISIGINSGTNSPALTRLIRRKIGEELPDYYGDLADQLGRLRITVRELFPEEKDRRAILGRAAEEAFSRGRILTDQELKDLVREMTGGESGTGTHAGMTGSESGTGTHAGMTGGETGIADLDQS